MTRGRMTAIRRMVVSRAIACAALIAIPALARQSAHEPKPAAEAAYVTPMSDGACTGVAVSNEASNEFDWGRVAIVRRF